MALERYGSTVPFAEPPWYQGSVSAHYNASHAAFRDKVRQFVDVEVAPFVDDWEEAHASSGYELSRELADK